MIKIKNTESLGYRGLMEQSLNNEDYHHAFIFEEKLFTLNPKIDKLYQEKRPIKKQMDYQSHQGKNNKYMA